MADGSNQLLPRGTCKFHEAEAGTGLSGSQAILKAGTQQVLSTYLQNKC